MAIEHSHFYPDQERVPSFRPTVVYSGVFRQDKDWTSKRHRHNFCEILFVTAGSGVFVIGNKKYTVRTGDVVIYNTGVFHSERSTSDDLSMLFFAIDNVNVPGMNAGCLVPDGVSPVIEAQSYDDVFKTFLSVMADEINKKNAHYKAISTHIATLFCYYILRLYAIKIENPVQIDICNNVKHYLENYYMTEITLETLSAMFHVSKYYLIRMFKEHIGLPPMKYLLYVRISAAKELLSGAGMSIAEIANEVGYVNAPAFGRAFKAAENITPSEYRSNNKSN